MFLRKFTGLVKRAPSAAAAALTFAMVAAPLANADTFYWTSTATGAVNTTVTPGNSTTLLFSPSDNSAPDSLIFNSDGSKIIYTSTGGVFEINSDGTGPATPLVSNTTLGSQDIEDLALEPGGNSVLVSVTGTGGLWRISLTGAPNPTQLQSFGTSANLRGLTYVGNELFAVVGGNLEQLDPTTGVPLVGKSVSLGSGISGDGLTYDPISGNLFVASQGASELLEFTTSLVPVAPSPFNCACGNFDGVVADGSGNIDIADVAGSIVQFNGSTFTTIATGLTGIDDLAPLSGLGAPKSPSGVPEPGSLTWLLAGAPFLLWKYRRKAVD